MNSDFYQFQHFGLSEHMEREEGKNLNFRDHLHQSFEFLTVCDGEMTINVDNKIYNLKAGESIFIFPNQIHSISSVSSEHKLWIFSSELVKAYASKVAGKIPVSNKFNPDSFITDVLFSTYDSSSLIEKKGIFYLLCAHFDKTAEYVTRRDDDKNLLYKIFKFVESNYAKDCSLESLAKDTGFSYSYLSRYFKKIVGISYNKYVNQYRISNACYILSNSDCPVIQCALDCGYDSLRSFNRNFAECLGVSPSEYRSKRK